MKDKAKSLAEGVSESTVACLLAMVQGNVLSLTVSHLLIATQTGLIAGSIALTLNLVVNAKPIWVAPLLLAVSTTAVDYLMHPSSFGSVATEAIVTGVMAGGMAYLVAAAIRLNRKRRGIPAPS